MRDGTFCLLLYLFFIIFLTAFVSICPSHTLGETSKNALISLFFFIHPLTLFSSAFRLITIWCFYIEFLQFSVRGNEEMTIWKKKERRRSLGIFWASNKIYKLDKIFFLSFLYFFTSSFSREHRNDKMKLLSPWYFDNKV